MVAKEVNAIFEGVAKVCEEKTKKPKPIFLPQNELRKKSMNSRKGCVNFVSPRHYQTMIALTKSYMAAQKAKRVGKEVA